MVKIDDEYIYESMVRREVFPEYCDLVITYIKPILETKYVGKYENKEELETFVGRKINSYYEAGRVKAHGQKSRAKQGIKELNVGEVPTFVAGCYEELRVQLLRQLRRALGDTEDYSECETFLTEKVKDEIKAFKAMFKKENKNG